MSRLAVRHQPSEKWAMTDRMSELRVSAKDLEGARVLSVDGVLDATTYVVLRDAIVKAGYEPTDMSPEDFSAFLHAEADRYAEAVKAAKIEPE